MNKFFFRLLLALVCTSFLAAIDPAHVSVAFAQSKPGPETGTTGKANEKAAEELLTPANISGWNIELEQMEKALSREGIRDSDFDKIHADATLIFKGATKLVENLQPELKTLRERFAQLGPIPKKDQPAESDEISQKRTKLSESLSAIDGSVKAAQLVIIKAKQIRDGIVERRRARFVRSVTSKSMTIFDPRMWQPFFRDSAFIIKGLPVLFSNFATTVSARMAKMGSMELVVYLSLIGWLGFLYLLSRGLNRTLVRIGNIETDRSMLAVTALFNILTSGVIPGMVLLGIIWILDSFSLISSLHRQFIYTLAFSIAIAVSVIAIAYAFLQPASPQRRIAKINDLAARQVLWLAIAGVISFVITWVIYDAGRALFASFEFGIAIKAIFPLAIAILTSVALRLIRKNRQGDTTTESSQGLSIFLNWNVLRSLTGAGIVLIFISLVTGYIALADFSANQIILTSSTLALLWLVLKIIDNNIVGCFHKTHNINEKISLYMGWKNGLTEQLGVVMIGFIRLTIILLTILVLLIPWGYRAQDWLDWISAAFFGFKVGDITISLSLILSSILVFLIGVVVTRSLQGWLSNRFLPTTHLDSGVRNSITTVFGYVGIITAAMITISFAGFDLTSLAFVAGALSLGIGFGLQSIVSNFVSGLILLAERPIKAGDWIVTSGGEGTVRKISVRSTEIQTFDRATVVVPNSSLITESVVNWNHRSSMGRIKLAIGVGYEADPQRVQEILLEIAENHSGILDIPHPIVYFMEFGASSLDFELRCYLADVGNGLSVKSDLRYAIFAALNAEGISIPYPQSDVHIKGFEPEKRPAKPKKRPVSLPANANPPTKDG